MSERNGHAGNGSGADGRLTDDGKVRVAIVGVGNCANSFIQGVQYYKDADPAEQVPGLMHVDLGGYHVSDIEFVAAFDIDAEKVGKDLSEAIWSGQNNTIKFADVPKLGVKVQRGMTHDGLGKYLKQKITKAPGRDRRHRRDPQGDEGRRPRLLPAGRLRGRRPSGTSSRRSRPGVGFVNCLPVFIAREDYWDKRFAEAGLPIIGDDIKSQVGATIVHRQLARLFHDRGVRMERTSQLNVGGNMDFYNMLERERLDSKKISKTNAVTSIMGHELPADDVHVGPSDYVPWLTDRKWAHIRLEGQVLRRRAAQRRAQARGLGLAQLGRDRDRRGADHQAGAQQRRRRPARRPVELPDEVAAQPAPRRRGARADRGVHRRARAQAGRRARPATRVRGPQGLAGASDLR